MKSAVVLIFGLSVACGAVENDSSVFDAKRKSVKNKPTLFEKGVYLVPSGVSSEHLETKDEVSFKLEAAHATGSCVVKWTGDKLGQHDYFEVEEKDAVTVESVLFKTGQSVRNMDNPTVRETPFNLTLTFRNVESSNIEKYIFHCMGTSDISNDDRKIEKDLFNTIMLMDDTFYHASKNK